MKDMFSAVLLGAVIGAAAAMFYLENENELSSAARHLKASSRDAINFLSNMSQDIDHSVRKQG